MANDSADWEVAFAHAVLAHAAAVHREHYLEAKAAARVSAPVPRPQQ